MAPGTLIRAARLERGVTQAELARRAHTSQSAVARIERGTTSPTLETLQRLAGALGLNLRIEAVDTESGVDPTLVAAYLRMTPVERLRRMAEAARSIARMRAAAR